MTEDSEANRLGIKIADGEASFTVKSLLTSLGGWWGVIEAIIPTLLYVVTFSISKNVLWSALLAGSTSLAFIVRQLVVRKSLASALAGSISVVVAVLLPLREGGQASDYFTVGLLTNLGYFIALVVSVLVRYPVVGILVALLTSSGFGWRKEKAKLRRFDAATLLWVGLFGLRLLVEAPLFFANQLQTLGVVKLVMGVPFYAMVLWLTWLVVRPTFKQHS